MKIKTTKAEKRSTDTLVSIRNAVEALTSQRLLRVNYLYKRWGKLLRV